MSIFEVIAANVTARDAAEHYGLKIGRNGRALCIWHNDKHRGDLTFYGNHCYCHACHHGGDSVALVAQLFNLSAWDAAAKLNADFKLNLNKDAPTMPTGPSRTEQRKREHERENRLWGTLCDVAREAENRLLQLDGAGDAAWDNPAFVKALEAHSRATIALENLWAKGVN